jgi:dolichol kinase/membrane-associated phospholipid phosphatase
MELLTYIWIFFSYFGDIAYWLGFTISFLLIYPFLDKKDKKKQKWILLYLLPAVLLSYFFSFFLKIIFKIPRICVGLEYCPSTYSFPSGHAAIASAFFSIVFINFSKNQKLYLPILLISILTSYSRIALKVHTFYDILGGVLVGTSISLSWYFFFKRIESGRDYKSFYFRKLIHMSGLVAIIIYLLEKNYAFYLLLLLTILFLISEILRIKNIYLPVLHEISNFCKKREEKGFLLEPFLFVLSLCMLTMLPKELFLAGSVPLVIGDSLAGLIGYRFGSHKLFYNKPKSLEGSITFFASTFVSLLLFFDIKTSFLLALFSTFFESILKRYENLMLPIGCVAFYLLLSL